MKKTVLQIKLHLLSAFLTFSLLLSITSVYGQEKIMNRSFEIANPNVPSSGATEFLVVSFNTTIPSWTHTAGTIDLHHSRHWSMGCPVGGGNQHIDLNTDGVIEQNVTGLLVGQTYTLSLYTSVHDRVSTCSPTGTSKAQLDVINVSSSSLVLNNLFTKTPTDAGAWTFHSFTFVAAETDITIRLSGISSCYGAGGVLIDLLSLTTDFQDESCNTNCDDDDWYEIGTTNAPHSNTVHAYRIGNAAIGTVYPIWNFKLTVDNRDDLYSQNDNRNAIYAGAMHTDCSFGYGVLINTNILGGTKALAVQGDGNDKAIIYGNGMSWFSNRMNIGGPPPPREEICVETIGGPILTINGTGLINGMNLTSDSRFKDKIEPLKDTRSIISKLNPVSYQFRTDEFKDRNFPQGSTYGFIAQELKEVLPNTVTLEADGFYSVNYIALIPVLTKAIKDQQATIEELQTKVDEIAELNKIKGSLEGSTTQKVEINKTAMLMQNAPNPLNDVTFIDYYLPASVTSAFIKVTDNNGRLVKAFPIDKTGYGQLELNCVNMAAGTYYYSLLIDNNVIDTKIMVISKN